MKKRKDYLDSIIMFKINKSAKSKKIQLLEVQIKRNSQALIVKLVENTKPTHSTSKQIMIMIKISNKIYKWDVPCLLKIHNKLRNKKTMKIK